MEQERESLGAASKALAEAASQLAQVLGGQARQAAHAGSVFSDAVASSLRGAAGDIAVASAAVASAALSEQVPRRQGRRPRQADQTRADLMQAGARVFAAQGFEGASVDDIAREAGYTKGAVYAHFGSKRDLFIAIALGNLDPAVACESMLPSWDAGEELDQEALAGQLERVGEDPAMLLAIEILAYTLRHPEDAAELATAYRAAFESLAQQVARRRRRRDDPQAALDSPPEQEDYDTVLGVLAVLNWATLGVQIIGPPVSAQSGARIIARLLG